MDDTRKLTTAEIGKYGEDVAVQYLQQKGYRILARNFRYSHREIDIIAENDMWTAFVEVKSRTNSGTNFERFGPPRKAVTLQKQKFIISAANHYIRTFHPTKWPSLDVIEVVFSPKTRFGKPIVESIHHMERAYRVR